MRTLGKRHKRDLSAQGIEEGQKEGHEELRAEGGIQQRLKTERNEATDEDRKNTRKELHMAESNKAMKDQRTTGTDHGTVDRFGCYLLLPYFSRLNPDHCRS